MASTGCGLPPTCRLEASSAPSRSRDSHAVSSPASVCWASRCTGRDSRERSRRVSHRRITVVHFGHCLSAPAGAFVALGVTAKGGGHRAAPSSRYRAVHFLPLSILPLSISHQSEYVMGCDLYSCPVTSGHIRCRPVKYGSIECRQVASSQVRLLPMHLG